MYNNGMNPLAMLMQIKSNPAQFLSQRGVQIPEGMNDPSAILNHLLSTGKVTQTQINQMADMAKMFMR